MTTMYEARDNFTIIRTEKYTGKHHGLEMPETAAESTRFFVVSAGDKIDTLHEGDEVMIMGKLGEEYVYVPGERDLLVIDSRFVPYIIHRGNEEE